MKLLRAHTSMLPSALVALGLALAVIPARAHAQINELPQEMRGVGVDEHLGDTLPLDAVFRDEQGRQVRLGQFFDGRRPIVLDLYYDRCPMLCSMVLNAQVHALRDTAWSVGDQYDVITISIDPTERPEDSAPRRARLLHNYGRPGAERGWHFLTGDATNIRRVADAVGFHYRYDERQNQYAHPAVFFLLTPAGHIARYLYGIEFNPTDVRMGLLDASEGRAVSTVERVLLFCYHYDPQGKKYVLVAMRVMQLGGAATAVLLGGLLAVLWARERRRRNAPPGGPTGPNRKPDAPLTPPQDVRG